jgi:hypothetical protein
MSVDHLADTIVLWIIQTRRRWNVYAGRVVIYLL